MRICVFVCSHGLGHLRRVLAISSFILKNEKNIYIDAYLNILSLRTLEPWSELIYFKNHPRVNIKNFVYPKISSKNKYSLSEIDWLTIKIPNLEIYDVVWSDNILDILELRPDTKITGSFLWFENMEKFKSDKIIKYTLKQKELLKRYNPQMAGVDYFSTKAVKHMTKFYPVGLYKYSNIQAEKKERNILISCGLAGEEEEITRSTVKFIIDNNIEPPETLFVEPRLIPNKHPKWMKKASFSGEMFHSCVAACIRPGIGTVSDALVNHLKIFAFSTLLSFEMVNNCEKLKKFKLGENCLNPLSAYLKAIEFAKSKKKN